MTSVKLLLNRSRALRSGTYPLVFQIIHRRQKKLIYTPYKLYPQEFDPAQGKVCFCGDARLTLRSVQSMNRAIVRQRKVIDRCIGEFELRGTDYTAAELVARCRIGRDSLGLLHYMDLQADRKQKLGRFGTASAYRSTLASVASFTAARSVRLSDVDRAFVRDYRAFLLQRGLSDNTVCFYLRNLKSICRQAAGEGYRTGTDDPFLHMQTSPRKTIKRALDRDTVRRIWRLDLAARPKVELARDLFLFGFFTRGMSFVDMLYLKKGDLLCGDIVYRRHKTGQCLRIALTPQLRQLIEKYRNDSEYVFPILKGGDPDDLYRQYRRALERENRSLKKVSALLGLETPLTTYMARHSWATQARDAGAPVAVISQGLGHTSERTTRIYLKEFDRNIVDEVNAAVSAL